VTSEKKTSELGGCRWWCCCDHVASCKRKTRQWPRTPNPEKDHSDAAYLLLGCI